MKIRATCRVCDGGLELILSLGKHYVSNFILPGEDDGLEAPLELMLCRQCTLLQLGHTVPAESLYRNYWYRSGTNRSMRDALADIAHKAEALVHLSGGDTVLDIGCNDGTLLAAYATSGIHRVGFDPAQNLVEFSRQVAGKIVPGFFDADTFLGEPELKGCRPKVVTSIAMFYDLEDPSGFVADVKKVMHPDGVWIIQMSYLPLMLKQNAFDNVCHEHLEYYSLRSLEHLLRRYDLEVVDVELNDVNGGSFRIYVRNRGGASHAFGDLTTQRLGAERVHALREREEAMRLDDKTTYEEFAMWVERIKEDVVGFIGEQARRGKRTYVYGASTKGNTLLQYCGLDRHLIPAAAERNPDKWGRVTVGTRIPIVSEEQARKEKPDYFLVLPWHFAEEFRMRERQYLRGGGRFIMPMPHFSLV